MKILKTLKKLPQKYFSEKTSSKSTKIKTKELITFLNDEKSPLIWSYIQKNQKSPKIQNESTFYNDLFSQITEIQSSLSEPKISAEDKSFYTSELELLKKEISEETPRIIEILIQNEYKDTEEEIESCKIEFRGGVGGIEGFLFAEELSHNYENYLISKSYSVTRIKDTSKSIKLKVFGKGAYKKIKCESGVHKVIRIPKTETKGRLHSSTMSLVVLPEVPFDFKINEKDLRFDYMRSQGPGGQHVNKIESACRATHPKYGVSVLIQESREQHKNKKMAVEILTEKIYQIEFERKMGEEKQDRKMQIGGGDRSDKIRTFNFQQDRITDHRLGKTVFGIERVLNGEKFFDECIEEVLREEKEQKFKRFFDMLKEMFLE